MPEIAKTDQVVHDQVMGTDRQVLAGQPVPPELLDAYHEAGGETTESNPAAPQRVRISDDVASVVASRDVVVHDDAMGIDRQIIAGTRVPPDLLDAYAKETGETVTTPVSAATSDEELTGDDLAHRAAELKIKGRSSMTADELRDAVAKAEANPA
jgi:hypothetical protein